MPERTGRHLWPSRPTQGFVWLRSHSSERGQREVCPRSPEKHQAASFVFRRSDQDQKDQQPRTPTKQSAFLHATWQLRLTWGRERVATAVLPSLALAFG